MKLNDNIEDYNKDLYHIDSNGNLLLDEDKEPIPKTRCICFAHSSSECVCGAWSIDYDLLQ